MELLEVMLERRSVREYNGEEISDNALRSILEAGLLSPSSRNLCPVELITVKDKDALRNLARSKTAGADMLKSASCAVVVIGDSKKSDVWVEDCSLSMIYMQLRATELGVANCWIQCRNRVSQQIGDNENNLSSDEFVKRILDIPENYSVLAILSLGMTDNAPNPHTTDKADFMKVHNEKF